MLVNILNSIMILQSHFYLTKTCCKDIQPKSNISTFTAQMYNNNYSNEDAVMENNNVEELMYFLQ